MYSQKQKKKEHKIYNNILIENIFYMMRNTIRCAMDSFCFHVTKANLNGDV